MRALEFIRESAVDEMALSKYTTFGDFTKPGPFTGADKRLIPHPKNQLKTQKFFEQTPYDFRLFFSNIPGTGRYSEYGPMSPEEIRKVFPEEAAQQIIDGHDDAITVVYVGNKGDAKVMLTPWIMAHRFGHAVQAGVRSQKGWSEWREAEEHFFNTVHDLLKQYYGKLPRKDDTFRIKMSLASEYNALFNAIGSQKSSRKGIISRPYEFMYELLAQYIGTGKITLNPFPDEQGYGRKVFGRYVQYLKIKPEYRDTDDRIHASEILANDMEINFNNVLASSVGKIYVM